MIALDRGKRDSQEKPIKGFVAKFKMEFPVALLKGEGRQEIIDKYMVGPIPHIIVIDRKGIIRQVMVGGNSAALDAMVKKLLDEK